MASAAGESDVPRVRYLDVVSAVLVTVSLGASVMQRWHGYRLFDKCFSVFVLLTVITLPWDAIRMKIKGQKVEVSHVCILLLMVTYIFR